MIGLTVRNSAKFAPASRWRVQTELGVGGESGISGWKVSDFRTNNTTFFSLGLFSTKLPCLPLT